MQTVPPIHAPVQTVLIQGANLPAALFRSYVRLYASAWRRADQRTGPLDPKTEVAPLLGLPGRRARQTSWELCPACHALPCRREPDDPGRCA
jgi:hypothetical protein